VGGRRPPTLNAHYTDFDVASAMWVAANGLEFAGVRVLEPGVGSGTLLATAPPDVAIEAVGVEIDPGHSSHCKGVAPADDDPGRELRHHPLPRRLV
jgi:predicted RNA methylase